MLVLSGDTNNQRKQYGGVQALNNTLSSIAGITAAVQFVPFSKSGHKTLCLNWKVTLKKDGKAFLTTDYVAGVGHCPSYKQGRLSVAESECIRAECEKGRAHFFTGNPLPRPHTPPILPDLADVLRSLLSDAEAIDFDSFEEWALAFGFDPDSRKAEAIYRQCLEIGLKMRNALGEDGLAELLEACQ